MRKADITLVERRKRMDQESVDEIEAREQAATPGPWEWKATVDEEAVGIVSPDTAVMCGDIGHFEIESKDAEFIAHARADIPALLADNAAKDQQIATLTAEVGRLTKERQ